MGEVGGGGERVGWGVEGTLHHFDTVCEIG